MKTCRRRSADDTSAFVAPPADGARESVYVPPTLSQKAIQVPSGDQAESVLSEGLLVIWRNVWSAKRNANSWFQAPAFLAITVSFPSGDRVPEFVVNRNSLPTSPRGSDRLPSRATSQSDSPPAFSRLTTSWRPSGSQRGPLMGVGFPGSSIRSARPVLRSSIHRSRVPSRSLP